MKAPILATLVALLFTAGTLAFGTQQATAAGQVDAADKAVIAAQMPSYPLSGCCISGKAFSAESPAIDVVVDGQLFRVCCKKCVGKVEADPKASLAKIREAVIAEQKPLWPLTTCPVSGEAFGGEMGEPIDIVIGTRYAKLCCKGCIRSAKKDPAKFIADLDAKLMPELVKAYPIDKCVISGEKLGSMGAPIDMMYGHRLVRFCCKGCLSSYRKDPAGTVAKIYSPDKQAKVGKAEKKG